MKNLAPIVLFFCIQSYYIFMLFFISSVQFSHSVMSDSLQPHETQYARPPCPSPIARVYPNSCPLSWWCLLTISSSVVPFSSCLQFFPTPAIKKNTFESVPTSGSFQMKSALRVRWPKYWRFSFNISPSNEHPGLISFRMDWLDLLAVQGTLKSLLQHHSSKALILLRSSFFIVQLSHPYWRRQWQPTPVLLPGKSHGRRSLVGCSPWGSLGVGHDWATSLSLFTFMHWRRKWQPIPVFLPGESQGWGNLVGCCLWGCTESDTTEVT